MKWYYKLIISISIVSICSIMPGLLLYYLGYLANDNWNKNAVQTTCIIKNTFTTKNICYYQCNCITTCETDSKGSTDCTTDCDTCEYDCYNGYMEFVYYDILNTSYAMTIVVYSGLEDLNNLITLLNNNYPIGGLFSGYYNKNNPSDFKFVLQNPTVYMVFFIIFIIIGFGVFIIWGIIELIKFIKNKRINESNKLNF